MTFQTVVNQYPAPGIEGDWASANPYASVLNDAEARFQVAAVGVRAGRFGWTNATDSLVSNSAVGAGRSKPDGFIHRELQALITGYLDETSTLIRTGYGITLHARGDFWAKTLTTATKYQKVFAKLGTGEIATAAAGATIAGPAGNASFATNVMTLTSAPATAPAVGDIITSSGVAAGTYITAVTSGTGGIGSTYTLSTSPGTITAQAFTSTSYVETDYTVASPGAIGDVIKITNW